MMYLNGEGPLNRAVGGYMADLAMNLSACTLAIEHRWYGESLPAPLTNKALLTSTLTIDQAMRDIVALMEYFETHIMNTTITWFLVGGSYSGGMTVWMNERYPGRFKASWAASGVVRATFAYTDYDGHVDHVTSKHCSDALRNIMQIASDMWDDETTQPLLRTLFNIPSYNTKTDFMWAMADVSASSVQYSMKTDMCYAILPQATDRMAILKQYAAFVNDQWGPNFMNSCYYSSACLANASMSNQWAAAGYSWIWECCNEVAWWQIGYPGSIRNKNISTEYFMSQCRNAFYPNASANSWAFNLRHNGYHPVAPFGNIIATQGSDDPWSTTGLKYNQGPTFPVNTAECDNCGHCGSMMSPRDSDPENLKKQREMVLGRLTEWLGQ
jgi:pimeloyl-ACP methyl ester carboxylesterase